MSEDISKKTLLILVVIALVLSVVSTVSVLNSQRAVVVIGEPVDSGRVQLNVVDEDYDASLGETQKLDDSGLVAVDVN